MIIYASLFSFIRSFVRPYIFPLIRELTAIFGNAS